MEFKILSIYTTSKIFHIICIILIIILRYYLINYNSEKLLMKIMPYSHILLKLIYLLL